MRTKILAVAVCFSGALFAENFWPNSDFEKGGRREAPEGYTRTGKDKLMQRWGGPAASGSYALGLVDNSAVSYSSWSSNDVKLPVGAGGKLLTVKWNARYNVTGSGMRLSVVFKDQYGEILRDGTTHVMFRGQNKEWPAEKFEPGQQFILVPEAAVTMRFDFVSGGADTTMGECWIDDLTAEVK